MKIFVTAKTRVRKEGIVSEGKNEFVICVKEPAKEGRANIAIRKVLANYFGVAPSRVRLVSGATSKHKVFEVV
ncbi:MAG: DUF167 domain-containing protein [Patescibacteria group bacterium]